MTGEIGPELVQRTLYECPDCGKRFSTEGIYASHYRAMCAEVPGQDARSLLGEYVRLKDNGECGRVISADLSCVSCRVGRLVMTAAPHPAPDRLPTHGGIPRRS